MTRALPTADGTGAALEVTVSQVDLGAEQLISTVVLSFADGSVSTRVELGTAPDGTVFSDFLVPPPSPPARIAYADPIALDGFPAGAIVTVLLEQEADPVWTFEQGTLDAAPPSLVLPEPPSAAEGAIPASTSARVVAGADAIANVAIFGAIFRRVGVRRRFSVAR
jgi:hypothetical protein